MFTPREVEDLPFGQRGCKHRLVYDNPACTVMVYRTQDTNGPRTEAYTFRALPEDVEARLLEEAVRFVENKPC